MSKRESIIPDRRQIWISSIFAPLAIAIPAVMSMLRYFFIHTVLSVEDETATMDEIFKLNLLDLPTYLISVFLIILLYALIFGKYEKKFKKASLMVLALPFICDLVLSNFSIAVRAVIQLVKGTEIIGFDWLDYIFEAFLAVASYFVCALILQKFAKIFYEEQPSLIQNGENSVIKKGNLIPNARQLKTVALFSPLSLVIYYVLSNVTTLAVQTVIIQLNDYNSENVNVESPTWINSLLSAVMFFIILLFVFILFALMLNKYEKQFKTAAGAILPVTFILILINARIDYFAHSASGIIVEYNYNLIAVLVAVVDFISTVVFAVISYFISSAILKKVFKAVYEE